MLLSGSETTVSTASPTWTSSARSNGGGGAGSETSDGALCSPVCSSPSPPHAPSSPSPADHADQGDLGAFHAVFRALTLLNSAHAPPTHWMRSYPGPLPPPPPSNSNFNSNSEREEDSSDAGNAAAVAALWDQRRFPIAAPNAVAMDDDDDLDLPSPVPPDDDDEEDEDTEGLPDDDGEDDDEDEEEDEELPSLGLESALGFLAAERARFAVKRRPTSSATGADGSPRKKRRRRRRAGASAKGDGAESASPEYSTSTGDALSAPEPLVVPNPSRRSRSTRNKDKISRQSSVAKLTATPTAAAEIPTPASRPLPIPPSPQVQRLRSLANKLKVLYPAQADNLKEVLRVMQEPAEPGAFIDVRGPPATETDPVVHVFIDYSNILIGFISYIRRHPELHQRRSREDRLRLSHEALALILERGRPTARRELAASKPLYQPMTTAYQLGFDVHLFQRVPHEHEGTDSPASPSTSTTSPVVSPPAVQRPKGHHASHSESSITHPGSSTSSLSSSIPPPPSLSAPRPRWREQGVDECLQLKLYQSVVSDGPPGTIVLATGDAAPSQFNAAGFPGNVKVALDKGWSVELYAWESGLSSGWKRAFGAHERFSVKGMEMFAEDLVAVDAVL